MTTITSNPLYNKSNIPPYLIAEQLDEHLFYYKGFREVLRGEKTLEEIIGRNVLQFMLLQHIIRCIVLFDANEEKFMIGTNKAGLHMGHRRNVGNDLAIYDIKEVTPERIIGKYANFPPEVVVEVDIDVEGIEITPLDGAFLKTKRMLEFGVKKVIWIFTDSQKILIAEPNQPWLTIDWTEDIELIDGLKVNVANYLKKKGVL